MASSPKPATPDNGTRRWATMNRSFTLPSNVSTSSKSLAPTENGSSEGVETLYYHPDATVIKFTTSALSRSSPAAGSPARSSSSAGLLPWTSPRETTIAAGPMEIYRVNMTGSVSFLRSGSLLHVIMPRSQCWCVDDVSKFVIRVLPDTYYRIELPGRTEDDLRKVEQIKVTLAKVLFYERSSCPFSRSFSLDLPEMPDVKSRGRGVSGPAKKWKLDRAFSWKPQDGGQPRGDSFSSNESSSEHTSTVGSDDEGDSANTLSDCELPPNQQRQDFGADTPAGRIPVTSTRSFTEPAYTTVERSGCLAETGVDVDEAVGAIESAEAGHRARIESETRMSTSSGTRLFQAIPTDMPPSPPDSSAGLETADLATPVYEMPFTDARETLNLPVTSAPEGCGEPLNPDALLQSLSGGDVQLSDETQVYMREIIRQQDGDSRESVLRAAENSGEIGQPEIDSSAILPDHSPELALNPPDDHVHSTEDPYAAIQARIQARRSIGGTTSFHPAVKTLSRSSTSSASSSGTMASNRSNLSLASSKQQQAVTTALVRKACAVFIGPPAQLVALMLRIAARFANATFGVDSMFYVANPTGSSPRVPGSFSVSSGSSDEDDDEEDDFGVPIRNPIPLAQREMNDAQVAARNGLRERRK